VSNVIKKLSFHFARAPQKSRRFSSLSSSKRTTTQPDVRTRPISRQLKQPLVMNSASSIRSKFTPRALQHIPKGIPVTDNPIFLRMALGDPVLQNPSAAIFTDEEYLSLGRSSPPTKILGFVLQAYSDGLIMSAIHSSKDNPTVWEMVSKTNIVQGFQSNSLLAIQDFGHTEAGRIPLTFTQENRVCVRVGQTDLFTLIRQNNRQPYFIMHPDNPLGSGDAIEQLCSMDTTTTPGRVRITLQRYGNTDTSIEVPLTFGGRIVGEPLNRLNKYSLPSSLTPASITIHSKGLLIFNPGGLIFSPNGLSNLIDFSQFTSLVQIRPEFLDLKENFSSLVPGGVYYMLLPGSKNSDIGRILVVQIQAHNIAGAVEHFSIRTQLGKLGSGLTPTKLPDPFSEQPFELSKVEKRPFSYSFRSSETELTWEWDPPSISRTSISPISWTESNASTKSNESPSQKYTGNLFVGGHLQDLMANEKITHLLIVPDGQGQASSWRLLKPLEVFMLDPRLIRQSHIFRITHLPNGRFNVRNSFYSGTFEYSSETGQITFNITERKSF
jgi:hypothetical protein